LVRDEFQCEAGQAQEFVTRFKEMAGSLEGHDVIERARVLTDLSGRFDTVVVESEIESIDAYLAMMRTLFADPDFQARQAELGNTAYRSGTRTFYTIEATYDPD
jgi:heme-degrading monooxygenase HmoA